MKARACPKLDMACVVDVAEVSWVRPRKAPVLCMACFLSAAKGDPIKVHSWLTVIDRILWRTWGLWLWHHRSRGSAQPPGECLRQAGKSVERSHRPTVQRHPLHSGGVGRTSLEARGQVQWSGCCRPQEGEGPASLDACSKNPKRPPAAHQGGWHRACSTAPTRETWTLQGVLRNADSLPCSKASWPKEGTIQTYWFSTCMPPSQGPPVPASPHAAWTPGKPLRGGCWPQSQQGYQSQVAYAACEATPRYTPSHPWSRSKKGHAFTDLEKKSNECYFGSTPTWAKNDSIHWLT